MPLGALGREDAFPRSRLRVRCRFSRETFAGQTGAAAPKTCLCPENLGVRSTVEAHIGQPGVHGATVLHVAAEEGGTTAAVIS